MTSNATFMTESVAGSTLPPQPNVQVSSLLPPTGNAASLPSASSPHSLEDLMSPPAQQSKFENDSLRGSLQSNFDNIGLDDESRFSTVTLSKESPSPRPSSPSPDPTAQSPSSHEQSSIPPSLVPRHAKSDSVITIRDPETTESGNENEVFEESLLSPNGTSSEGQQRIQEEFSRLQKEDEDKNDNSGAQAIDWDFWGEVISDYHMFATEKGDILAEAITRGIPQSLRGMMWQLMAAAKDPELEAVYSRLLKESSPHEKVITRDLGRAFPQHDYFTDGKGVGQENLFNVLKAYSLYDPQVGYCQGMHFVVAILLLNMPDEEAFSLLVRLMQVYDLRGHFLPDMPKLQQRLFQFDRLVEDLLPVLNVHFLRQGVKSSMFCSQWFLTMFSYRFPLPVVFRIYDNCLASGIEAMFGFGIALLHQNEQRLLQMKFDEILVFLNKNLLDHYLMKDAFVSDSESDSNSLSHDVDRFVEDAVNLRITPFMLDNYAREYEDMVRQSTQHALEMEELRNTNRNLSNQVKSLESSLATLNAEHVDLLNELVKLRLQHEETESQLVSYKLLYAEAMHQHEDSQSTHNRFSNSSHLSRISGPRP